jgi:DNA-binding PadR family transcriptional regulator
MIPERFLGLLKKSSLIGDFQLQVLSVVSTSRGRSYGAEIRKKMQNRFDRGEIHMPQVYAALKRLTDLGLLVSEVDETTSPGQRGRPRRFYSLTTSGLEMLEHGRASISMSQRISDLEASRPSPA